MPKTKKKLYGKSRTVPVLKTTLQVDSWIVKGKMRKFVFQHIQKRTIPSEIVTHLVGIDGRKSAGHYAQVSRAIAELEAIGLIRCLNPEERTGRFYELTPRGKAIRKNLAKQ